MTEIQYITGGDELLDDVRPLWEQINKHHSRISPHFSEGTARVRWEDRSSRLKDKTANGRLFIVLARTGEGINIGYCIASVYGQRRGEVDSIFLGEEYRRQGIGSRMLSAALAWLNEEKALVKEIYVMVGNEDAFPFYQKFGFFPRTTLLIEKSGEPKG